MEAPRGSHKQTELLLGQRTLTPFLLRNFQAGYLWLSIRIRNFVPFAPVPSGYPNPTRYPVFLSIPGPTRFSFRNHRVAGNPKHRVLPDISGITCKRKTIPSSGAFLRNHKKDLKPQPSTAQYSPWDPDPLGPI